MTTADVPEPRGDAVQDLAALIDDVERGEPVSVRRVRDALADSAAAVPVAAVSAGAELACLLAVHVDAETGDGAVVLADAAVAAFDAAVDVACALERPVELLDVLAELVSATVAVGSFAPDRATRALYRLTRVARGASSPPLTAAVAVAVATVEPTAERFADLIDALTDPDTIQRALDADPDLAGMLVDAAVAAHRAGRAGRAVTLLDLAGTPGTAGPARALRAVAVTDLAARGERAWADASDACRDAVADGPGTDFDAAVAAAYVAALAATGAHGDARRFVSGPGPWVGIVEADRAALASYATEADPDPSRAAAWLLDTAGATPGTLAALCRLAGRDPRVAGEHRAALTAAAADAARARTASGDAFAPSRDTDWAAAAVLASSADPEHQALAVEVAARALAGTDDARWAHDLLRAVDPVRLVEVYGEVLAPVAQNIDADPRTVADRLGGAADAIWAADHAGVDAERTDGVAGDLVAVCAALCLADPAQVDATGPVWLLLVARDRAAGRDGAAEAARSVIPPAAARRFEVGAALVEVAGTLADRNRHRDALELLDAVPAGSDAGELAAAAATELRRTLGPHPRG